MYIKKSRIKVKRGGGQEKFEKLFKTCRIYRNQIFYKSLMHKICLSMHPEMLLYCCKTDDTAIPSTLGSPSRTGIR